ncbi:MAG: ABC transporter permease [Chloroflexi bacterium]|nr:ABC transporter permease [Chloroflexota bacterium]
MTVETELRPPATLPVTSEPVSEPATELPFIHIHPSKGWIQLNLRELWDYRELAYLLAWRDVTIRYKQTVFGASWAIIQPLLMMVAFSIFFGQLAKVPSNGIPYPIFSYTALLPWNYFAQALTRSSNVLVGSTALITKVYFPRMLLPISSVLSPLFDFAIAFVVLLGMMVYYQVYPTPAMLALPVLLAMAVMSSVGTGMWLSALNVDYRDFSNILPFLVQVWMFATPVAFSSTLLDEPWRTLYGLNPMTGVIEGFRWALLGQDPMFAQMFLSALVSIVLLLTGAFYYRRTERTFADIS